MLTNIKSSVLLGVTAEPVEVEVQVAKGLPSFELVGMPDKAVRESRVRVKAALASHGVDLPPRRIVLNLAPADLPKSEAVLDLAMAVGVLAACGNTEEDDLQETAFIGELSLHGTLRPVRGALAHVLRARASGATAAVVPRANQYEAALAQDIKVYLADDLGQVIEHLNGRERLDVAEPSEQLCQELTKKRDFIDVRGQARSKRALTIAAVGSHHVLMSGPPGAGKTMLATRLPSILPEPGPAELEEIAAITTIHAPAKRVIERPFRAPHHTATPVALVGGGDPVQPGEVTLAHGGVLFLDELPEFRREAVEVLRTTMETGTARVVRARHRVTMPARPLIIAAMNPCRCGHLGSPHRVCRCSAHHVTQYQGKVSGPLRERFGVHISVAPTPPSAAPGEETSAQIRERIGVAQALLEAMASTEDEKTLEQAARTQLDSATTKLRMSMRTRARMMSVGRSIAALAGREVVRRADVLEALDYRPIDPNLEQPPLTTKAKPKPHPKKRKRRRPRVA